MKFLLSLFAAAVLIGVSGVALAADDKVVEGVVQSVSGDTLTVKTDDGRTTIVEASEVDRRRIALGEKVTVTGEFAPELNKFKARSIQVARAGA